MLTHRGFSPTRRDMRPPILAAPLLALQVLATDARAQRAEPIASLGWLTGCLEARSAARVVEEQRMPLRAGTPSA